MPVSQLPITNGFYVSNSLPISAQECTNWYVVVEGAPALAQETLRGTPGIEQVETSGVVLQANRGAHTMAGVPYFVNGANCTGWIKQRPSLLRFMTSLSWELSLGLREYQWLITALS